MPERFDLSLINLRRANVTFRTPNWRGEFEMPKAVRFHQLGGPEVLQIEEAELREPGPGEVAMRMKAAGLNRAESMYFHGEDHEKPALPARLGYGVVDNCTA